MLEFHAHRVKSYSRRVIMKKLVNVIGLIDSLRQHKDSISAKIFTVLTEINVVALSVASYKAEIADQYKQLTTGPVDAERVTFLVKALKDSTDEYNLLNNTRLAYIKEYDQVTLEIDALLCKAKSLMKV
jgi:hypothetical protein